MGNLRGMIREADHRRYASGEKRNQAQSNGRLGGGDHSDSSSKDGECYRMKLRRPARRRRSRDHRRRRLWQRSSQRECQQLANQGAPGAHQHDRHQDAKQYERYHETDAETTSLLLLVLVVFMVMVFPTPGICCA